MDPGFRLLAAKYILRQTKQLAGQLEGVRAAEDIEFVHRARVATRRLRAALRMFGDCFGRKKLRRWRKAIQKTTARLSIARDRDVQIDYLCSALSTLDAKECFPGIARILVELERQREKMQRKVVKAVDRLEKKGVLGEMGRAMKKIARRAEAAGADLQSLTSRVRTQTQIIHQLDELFRRQDSLANPNDRDRHHEMRIAAKRLRYTMEISKPVYPGRLEEPIEAVKKVQSLLGDIHDCDVWLDHLDEFTAKRRKHITALFGHAGRLARLQPGIEYLRQNRRNRRDEAFRQLVEYWKLLGRQGVWQSLTRAILPQNPPSAESAPLCEESAVRASESIDAASPARPQKDNSPAALQVSRKPVLTAEA